MVICDRCEKRGAERLNFKMTESNEVSWEGNADLCGDCKSKLRGMIISFYDKGFLMPDSINESQDPGIFTP